MVVVVDCFAETPELVVIDFDFRHNFVVVENKARALLLSEDVVVLTDKVGKKVQLVERPEPAPVVAVEGLEVEEGVAVAQT